MFNLFRRNRNEAASLIGDWKLIRSDDSSMGGEQGTSLIFSTDGKLTYIFHQQDKDEIVLLTYHVSDRMLITNQPSALREEKTEFGFDDAGNLILKFDGVQSIFERKQPAAQTATHAKT